MSFLFGQSQSSGFSIFHTAVTPSPTASRPLYRAHKMIIARLPCLAIRFAPSPCGVRLSERCDCDLTSLSTCYKLVGVVLESNRIVAKADNPVN